MKKYHASLTRRGPDPRSCRFPLPNRVWEYKLRPVGFVILSYLCFRVHCGEERAASAETVAGALRLSVSTVKKYLSDLMHRGLVTEEGVPAPALQRKDGKYFFSLPNEIFLFGLSPSAFMVYAYLLLIENRRTHTCHPSYNSIAARTGLTKNTVMRRISELLDSGLISAEHSCYYDSRGMKWNGNNLYTVLPMRAALREFYRRQLDRLELDAERERVHNSRQNTPQAPL